jgi:transposase
MAFREVSMIEVREVLRLVLAGVPKKRVARLVGVDPKTVRAYAKAAAEAGGAPGSEVSDELVADVLNQLQAWRKEREHGESWALCEREREFIDDKLKNGVRLTKVGKLLRRRGVEVPYATLYRYAREELGFGRKRSTIPVEDGQPGKELQVDVGWVLTLEPGEDGRRRRVRAFIFTASVSRHRFVYPCLDEKTERAIEACEAAWAFYGGVFEVLIPDNTKAIVARADPLDPLINKTFLEYSQARDFVVDAARVRKPQDKGKVERAVSHVRDDCFGGEKLSTVEDARRHAVWWAQNEYGMRRHSTTNRLPKEHFETIEKPHLKPVPDAPYDVPSWSEPKVGRDQLAQVQGALYSLPERFIGKRLTARADRALVRFFDSGIVVKVHERKRKGERAIDANDYPPEKSVYARRDLDFLKRQAERHGEAIGLFAKVLLDGPLPWTKMRRVYALLGLVKRYGAARVEDACQLALINDMLDVKRLRRMLESPRRRDVEPTPSPATVIPIARYLRPSSTYAINKQRPLFEDEGEDAHDDDERPSITRAEGGLETPEAGQDA